MVQPIPYGPKVSFSSISSLTDLLRDLPFVRPIDSNLIDFDVDANEDDATDKLKLIDNKTQFERSVQLLNSTETSLVESLSKLLLQVDINNTPKNSLRLINSSRSQSRLSNESDTHSRKSSIGRGTIIHQNNDRNGRAKRNNLI